MNSEIKKCVDEFKSIFPTSFVYKHNELVVEPKNNNYFRLDNIKTETDFKCKVLEYVSRNAHKHPVLYWKNWFKRGFNSYFRIAFTDKELEVIYRRLGNGVNRELCIKFIESDYNMTVLEG